MGRQVFSLPPRSRLAPLFDARAVSPYTNAPLIPSPTTKGERHDPPLLVAALFALSMMAPAAVATAAPAPITVQATREFIVEIYYYSDATYTVEVWLRVERMWDIRPDRHTNGVLYPAPRTMLVAER